MASQPSLWDVTYSKHKGNPESVAANLHAHPGKALTRQQIHEYVSSRGRSGATLKEIADELGKQPHEISGRLTEMKTEGADYPLYKTTERRDGCAVLVARQEWVNPCS